MEGIKSAISLQRTISEEIRKAGETDLSSRLCDCLERALHSPALLSAASSWNECGSAICPICDYKRTERERLRAFSMMGEARRSGLDILFLTLTLRNAEKGRLGDKLDELESAWDRLLREDSIRRGFLYASKSTEVTYSGKKGWHPHIHALLTARKGYFAKEGIYLSFRDWLSLWEKAIGKGYSPRIYVQAAEPTVLMADEAAKYTLRHSDIMGEKDRASLLLEAERALRGREMYSGRYIL